MKILLERTGFNCVSIATPGKLDIDILYNNKMNITDRFWKSFLNTANEQEKAEWQKLITDSGRSSHMMIVGSK